MLYEVKQEEFRNVRGSSTYLVSNLGHVYSLRAGRRRRLKTDANSNGYLRVSVRFDDGTRKTVFVHRLVAETFLPTPGPGKDCVCHKDDCPTNNSAENLWWGSHGDNMADMSRKGRHGLVLHPEKAARGERHASRTKPHRIARGQANGRAEITTAHVRAIRAMADLGFSTSEIARALRISRGAAKCVVQGKTWRHVA